MTANPEPLAPSPTPALRYAARPGRLTTGNLVRPLFAGADAYPAMLAAIEAARRTISLEVYIFEGDTIGKRFAGALAAAAERGVSVRVIVDAVGSFDLPDSTIVSMRRAGVELIEFHPVAPWRERWNLTRRDHRKILVVDDEVGFTGGLNIADDYAPESDGGGGWHDVHCEIRGPAVRQLAAMFRRVWVREGGSHFDIGRPPPAVSPGGCLVGIVENRELRKRWAIRRAYLHAINRAKSQVAITNAYFLPDRGMRRALQRCAARGVRVRVIVPEHSDVKAVEYAAEYMIGRLLDKGIEFFGWPDTMMHAKTAVVDGEWAVIGSYNLDHRSLLYNLEVVAEVLDPDFAGSMLERFEKDAAGCTPLTKERLQRRGWVRRTLGWFFYQLRRWL